MITKVHPEPFNHFFVYQSSCRNWIGFTSCNFQHCSCFCSFSVPWLVRIRVGTRKPSQDSMRFSRTVSLWLLLANFKNTAALESSSTPQCITNRQRTSLWLPHTCLNTNHAGSDNDFSYNYYSEQLLSPALVNKGDQQTLEKCCKNTCEHIQKL